MIDTVLGQQVEAPKRYSPQTLVQIKRQSYQHLQRGLVIGFDQWNAYEFSWLDSNKLPQIRALIITISQSSSYTVESKSLKLYLNSFYNEVIESEQQVIDTLTSDLLSIIDHEKNTALLKVELLTIDQLPMTTSLAGQCLESIVEQGSAIDSRQFYTHLFRSLCPVTSQPDWATVIFQFDRSIVNLEHARVLLDIILTYRNHQAFHEHCVELMFEQLRALKLADNYAVQALFCRRGGIDINPYRSCSEKLAPFNGRTMRQ